MGNKFSTGSKDIDRLMDGGISLGAPSLLFGIPNLGKTWFCFQIACMCTRDQKHGGLGRPVLYLDTETFFTPDVFDRFYAYFRKRWPDLPAKPMIEVRIVKDIFELGKLFGIHYEIIHEDRRVSVVSRFPTHRQEVLAGKGKSELKETTKSGDYIKDCPLAKELTEKKYGIVIIDSLTAPIKSVIPSASQNFPARASILQELLGTFYTICQDHNCAIFLTDHITRSPMEPGYVYGLGTPWGGQDVTYYVKQQFGLYRSTKDQNEKYPMDMKRLRRIERHRYPGLEVDIILSLLAKDTGYIDVAPVSSTQGRPAEAIKEKKED